MHSLVRKDSPMRFLSYMRSSVKSQHLNISCDAVEYMNEMDFPYKLYKVKILGES